MGRFPFSIVLVLILLLPIPSLSDSWEEFQKFNDTFYFMDDQQFLILTCTVVLPDLEDMLKESRDQIRAAGKNIIIKDSLSDFTLILPRKGNPSFFRPDISVELIGTQAPPGPDFERSAQLVDRGFQTAVDGAVMTLEGLLGSFKRPDRPEYRLETFQGQDDRVFMSYELKGVFTEVACSQMECTRTALSTTTEARSTETYVLVDGKKVLQTISGTIKQSRQTVETELSLTYQTIEGLRVPFMIRGTSTMSHATGSMEGNFNMYLKDCKVN